MREANAAGPPDVMLAFTGSEVTTLSRFLQSLFVLGASGTVGGVALPRETCMLPCRLSCHTPHSFALHRSLLIIRLLVTGSPYDPKSPRAVPHPFALRRSLIECTPSSGVI